MPSAKGLRVAVVGATGMVGRELLGLLERSPLPVSELRPFSSGTRRSRARFRGRLLPAPAPSRAALRACDLVFFASSDAVSRRLAPGLARAGVWVIDDSSAFRQHPKVPLVIPEVNPGHLRRDRRLIAGPNCTMAGLAVAGALLHRRFGIREVRLATYQSVSGAGRAALQELLDQTRAQLRRLGSGTLLPSPRPRILPAPIAFNVVPQVGGFDGQGGTSEERKVADELRKVWSAPALKVSVTAVRVPSFRGHSLAAWLRLAKPATPARLRSLLSRTPGLRLCRGLSYPTALACAGRPGVHAGRLRPGVDRREVALWVVSDNLLKGAAYNSLQVALELLRRGWLRARP